MAYLQYRVNGRSYREIVAGGNGGQFVILFPDLDMVSVTAANHGDFPTWYKFGTEIIPQSVVSAVSAP